MFEIFIALVFIAVMYFLLTSHKKVVMELYRQQAAKRNGKVKLHLFLFPKLMLYDQGTEIVISQDPGSKNSPPTTYMKCTLGTIRKYKFSISPENTLVKIGKSLGMKDIQTGNSEFDESFLVRGDDDMVVRSILTPEIQENLIELEERYPEINIENKEFAFSAIGLLKKEKQLDPLIETGLKIIKRASEI